MALTATVKASVAANLTGSPDIGSVVHNFTEAFSLSIANGTSADQATNVWTDERSIAASGTDSLDLAGGVTNALGSALTFSAVKALLVIADADNTNDVIVGGAAANTFVGPFSDATDKLVLGPGDCVLVTRRSAAGMAVTGGTGDILEIANSAAGSAVIYRIVVIGEA